MSALDPRPGRAFGRPIRSLSPARVALAGLATVLAIAAVAVVLQPWPVPPGPVADAAAPDLSPTVATPQVDFWNFVGGGGGGTGAVYTSLNDLGERSEALVMGSYTGEVEPGREPCDEESLANGAQREQACVFFANLTFRIDEVLAGSLPEPHRDTVKLEYMVDQGGLSRFIELVRRVPILDLMPEG